MHKRMNYAILNTAETLTIMMERAIRKRDEQEAIEEGEPTMSSITADELKTRGVAAIEAALANSSEALISVSGKNRFVVMPIEQFQHLRECELEAALAQTRQDLSEGRFVRSAPEEHVARVKRGGDD